MNQCLITVMNNRDLHACEKMSACAYIRSVGTNTDMIEPTREIFSFEFVPL